MKCKTNDNQKFYRSLLLCTFLISLLISLGKSFQQSEIRKPLYLERPVFRANLNRFSIKEHEEQIEDKNNKVIQRILNESSDSQQFYLIKQLNLREKEGVKNTFSSLQGGTFDEKTIILVTQNNRGLIYVCDQMLNLCSKQQELVVPQFVSIYASALSEQLNYAILGGSNGLLYIFRRTNSSSTIDFRYRIIGWLNQSKSAIKSIRLGPYGYDLWAGGSDKIVRYYVYNQTAQEKFSLKQIFEPMPCQILNVNFLQQQKFDLKLFLLVSCQSVTRIFQQQVKTGRFTLLNQVQVSNTAVMTPSVYVSSENRGVVAIGTNQAAVLIYYLNQKGFQFAQQLKQRNFGSIISLAFSQNGNFLVVGNHNFETFIYKRLVLDNGSYVWNLFQTLKFSQNVANFCKVVKISPNGKFIITGSDDLYIRFYTFGTCPQGTQFDNYGRCQSISYIGLIIGISGGVLILIIISFIIYKKKITIPAESIAPMVQYDLDYEQSNTKKPRKLPNIFTDAQ